MTRTFFCTLAILLLLAGFTAGCSQTSAEPSQAPPEPPPPTVRVAHPLQREIVEWIEFTGRLEAAQFVEIRSRVSGPLQSIPYANSLAAEQQGPEPQEGAEPPPGEAERQGQEGQDIQQGELLFVIDPETFQAELNNAEAALAEARAGVEQSKAQLSQANADKQTAESQLSFARTEFDRQRSLLSSNAVSQSEVDRARNEFLKAQASVDAAQAGIDLANAAIATSQAAVNTAQAAVDEAAMRLRHTKIRSPISGRVSRRYVSEGNLISGGSEQSTLLTTMVSLDPIYFMFNASEQQVLRFQRLIQQGTRQSARDVRYPVHLALADEQGFPHQGYIDFVDNRFDPNTATLSARATFANPDGLLTPGMFGKIQLAGTAPYEALLLPDAAVGADQSEQFVYVVDQDDRVRLQLVETGPLALGMRVIRNGITASDRIVVGGLQRVRPDIVVAPEMETLVAEELSGPRYESAPTEKN